MPTVTRFDAYCREKEKQAISAPLYGFRTLSDESSAKGVVPIGSDWSRRLFDGDFYRSARAVVERPSVSLVFVQSRNGNTGAEDPSTLGGGDTDKHLIYEGLSRVDADAVMAGAATASSERMVFSVWHPELVSLRLARGQARHPAQVVVTGRGDIPIEHGLMFNEPSLRVFVITRSSTVDVLRDRLRDRPWVEAIDAGDPLSLTASMRSLRRRGVAVVSAVGGRHTATALLKEGLVDDLYLTTSPIDAGEPHSPYYEGPPLWMSQVVEKGGRDGEEGVRFEHFLVSASPV
jgi:riboflavin biosynthesis pyrimidine reductase